MAFRIHYLLFTAKENILDTRVDAILALGHPGRETVRVRDTVAHAITCANELGDNFVDTCHLLAGLYREGNGVAYHVLNTLGVTRTEIDDWLVRRDFPAGPACLADDDIRTLFNAALAAAGQMSHSYIGTEHLLIGATADGTKSSLLISDLGLVPLDIENEVLHLLGYRLD